MSKDDNISAFDATAHAKPELDTNPNIVTFSKPYKFEDKSYTEVDLSGMECLTAEDMISASHYLTSKGNVSPTQEMNIEYACFMAGKATGLPVEFFRRLPLKDAVKIKNRVTNFFYGED